MLRLVLTVASLCAWSRLAYDDVAGRDFLAAEEADRPGTADEGGNRHLINSRTTQKALLLTLTPGHGGFNVLSVYVDPTFFCSRELLTLILTLTFHLTLT